MSNGLEAHPYIRPELERAHRALKSAHKLLADYDASATVEDEDVEPVLAGVERFVETVEAALSSADPDHSTNTEADQWVSTSEPRSGPMAP